MAGLHGIVVNTLVSCSQIVLPNTPSKQKVVSLISRHDISSEQYFCLKIALGESTEITGRNPF